MTKKSETIPLSVHELAQLIKISNGRAIRATYPGGALIYHEDTRWCLAHLAKWRGIEIPEELKDGLLRESPELLEGGVAE